ncbi:MAG: protein kinase, partial [Ignavibacteria bacterium]|nr:protein kinase [Ignavibacteria bacterium]
MVGRTISHYKILEKLGEGGMGTVYKAQDLKLDRSVALKFLPSYLSQAEEEKKRFVHEAKAASALDHPNICTIHEIDQTEDGQMFIAMACYEGKTVKEKIEHGPPPLDQAIDITIQVAQGLAKAHSQGIIHRDLKPANIMVTNDGMVKILDFGLAKLAGQTKLTKTGATLGTAAYMSPEQVKGVSADHRIDIWAFGVVLYEMVTGKQPFAGDYEQAVMYSIIHEEVEPMTTLRNEVPPELEQLVQKAMNKDANERHENMDELLAELELVKHSFVAEDVRSSTRKEKPLPSIAVLPFVNMSAHSENEYFSDGLAEELINALTKIKGLQIVARTSAFSFRGKEIDIREIGRKLNVRTVLEGSVRKAGNRLRITVQLVKVADGYQLWSERYDKEMDDVFAIQDEISLAIVERLKVELLSEEKATLAKRYTENPEAYSLYLKGRYYWNKRTAEGFRKAIENFRTAIAEDPTYASAYAGLADSYALLGDVGVTAIPPKEAFSNAKTTVQKALE